METLAQARPASHAAAIATLALAAAAAVVLGLTSFVWRVPANDDALVVLGTIGGGVLVAWAVVVGVVAVVAHVRRLIATRRVDALDAALLAAGAIVLIAIAIAHPIVGSGSASA